MSESKDKWGKSLNCATPLNLHTCSATITNSSHLLMVFSHKQLSYACITFFIRAVKRKGFGQQVEGCGRHDGGVTCAPNCPTTSAGSGGGPSSSSGPGTAGTAEPQRTGSETRREPSDRQCSASVSQVSNMSTHSGIHHSTSSGNGSIKDLPLNQVSCSLYFILSLRGCLYLCTTLYVFAMICLV